MMANEKRLIDANSLENQFIFLRKMWCGTEILSVIDQEPTVDAVEVVHGRWIMGVDEADYDYGICSVCGFAEREHFPCLYTPNYCPDCGAKMDGDGK